MAALRLPQACYNISQNYFIVFWLQELILRAAFNFQLSKALLTFEAAILLRAKWKQRHVSLAAKTVIAIPQK